MKCWVKKFPLILEKNELWFKKNNPLGLARQYFAALNWSGILEYGCVYVCEWVQEFYSLRSEAAL